MKELFKKYKSALRFLSIFVGLYLLLNTLYGVWIQHYYPQVDPFTISIAKQVAAILTFFGQAFSAGAELQSANVALLLNNEVVVYVFEGCNGINVMIVYLSFLVAYKGSRRHLLLFFFGGILLIYLLNLVRVALLAEVALFYPEQLYFFHKYLFTAFIYSVVFVLWYYWIKITA
jgi:exosortase family protein XrtF